MIAIAEHTGTPPTAHRGAPAADIDALADLMVRLGRFAADHADTVAEVDLNPVFVHPAGQGTTIAGALVVTRGTR